MTDVMVLEGEAYGKCLGHEDGALMNGISVLIKEAPQRILTSSTKRGTREKGQTVNQEEGPSQNMTMQVP